MKRYYLRVALIVVFTVAVGGVFLSLKNRSTLETVLDLSRLDIEALPELLQRIRDFHRVVTRDGLKVLEISADEASYFKNDRAIVIVAPKIAFFEKGKQVAAIAGKEGRLYLDGTEVESVSLKGAISLDLSGFHLAAKNLVYNRRKERIRVRGRAKISSPGMMLSGTDLTVDMVERTLAMGANVKMKVRHATGD